MPSQHEEFDLDVRLQGVPAGLSLQAETENQECNTRVDTCDATCDKETECAPDFSLAVTCDVSCEETCGNAQTCPVDTCGVECITVTCPTDSTCLKVTCGCDTNETCIHGACEEINTFPADTCDEDTDGCGPDGGGGNTGDCENPGEETESPQGCPH
jgi:hypothetical protein